MKLLFASDSFKGTLSSAKTISLLTKAAKTVFGDCEVSGVPVADGGEGTTDAVIEAVGGEKIPVTVQGPLGEPVQAFYGKLDDRRAVMEMAAASGLPLIPAERRDPRRTSTYGTGELIRAILDQGFTEISIALGGSATNDGGMGCMRALGVRFLDATGRELTGSGEDLGNVAQIDASGLDSRIRKTHFTVMCDVTNPLCGPDGATYTFGPQKGGTPEMLDELERGMVHYRDILKQEFGVDADSISGAGAAGGLGAALFTFLNAEPKSGIETVLQLMDFDRRLENVSLVVTGEGKADAQSCCGKVLQGIGRHCKAHGVPAVALVGSMGDGAEGLYDEGIASFMTTVNAVMPQEEALQQAEDLYEQSAIRMFRLIQVGRDL